MSITLRRKNAFRAIKSFDFDALTKAVKDRVEANWREDGGATSNSLLEYACELANIPAAEWLADHGADINSNIALRTSLVIVGPTGRTSTSCFLGPLTTSIYFKQAASLAFLMDRGVNLDLAWDDVGRVLSCREMLVVDFPDLLAEAEWIRISKHIPLAGTTGNRSKSL